MIGHWEDFDAGPTQSLNERIHVTLCPRNVILLNGNIYEQMGKPEAVVLMFDKLNSMIGLRPTRLDRPGAFPVKQKGRGRHRLIRATPFCKHYGIKVDRINAFVEPELDADGILKLDLKKKSASTAGLRSRAFAHSLEAA